LIFKYLQVGFGIGFARPVGFLFSYSRRWRDFCPLFVLAFSGIIFLIFNDLNVGLRASGLAQVEVKCRFASVVQLSPYLRQAACAYLKRFCFFF
jgi:hypothetical protein